MRRWLPLLLLAAAVGAQELRYTLGVRDDADGPVTAQAVPLPLCLSASVFSALVARVAAAGLLPGGALESRTLFAPSDEAFDDALAKLGLSRGRFLASPPERLAETLALHVAASGLARQKIPERFEIVEDFPRTASGKVRKDMLRADIRARIGG